MASFNTQFTDEVEIRMGGRTCRGHVRSVRRESHINGLSVAHFEVVVTDDSCNDTNPPPPSNEVRDSVRRIRDGGWVQLCDGLPFWPLDPRPEDVRIGPIAYALARLPRFCAHTLGEPYSVGQHSVHVSVEIERAYLERYGDVARANEVSCRQAALLGLLHDASEGCGLNDIARPVKTQPAFDGYRSAEARLQQCIYQAYGLDKTWELDMLHRVDRQMFRTEQRDLMPRAVADENRDDVKPFPWRVEPWPWREAERRFLARFKELRRA